MKINKLYFVITILVIILNVVNCSKSDPASDFKAEPIDGGKGVMITRYLGSKFVVNIPAKIQGLPVTNIGKNAFQKANLVSVTIPNSVSTIMDGAFMNNQLTSIIIPNSVTYIGAYVFSNNQLTDISIPENVANIDVSAFGDNPRLTAINVSSNNSKFSSLDGILYNKSFTTLLLCPQGKSTTITIPNTVKSIGRSAFMRTSLSSLTIPEGVISIEDWAFYDGNLTSVNISNGVKTIGKYAFHRNKLTSIIIPNTVTDIGEYAFGDDEDLLSITIGANVTLHPVINPYSMGGNGFERAYTVTYRKAAGTYTRNRGYIIWTKK